MTAMPLLVPSLEVLAPPVMPLTASVVAGAHSESLMLVALYLTPVPPIIPGN